MNKYLIIGVLGLLLIGFASYNNSIDVEEDVLDENSPITTVYNPATGEKWNGVEDYVYRNKIKEVADMEEQIYQGPVPEGYDLEHFRKTGETIKELNN